MLKGVAARPVAAHLFLICSYRHIMAQATVNSSRVQEAEQLCTPTMANGGYLAHPRMTRASIKATRANIAIESDEEATIAA